MKLLKHKNSFLLFLGIVFISCSSSGGGEEVTPVEPVAIPVAATLLFPENNTECNTGEIVGTIKSNVTFKWNAAQNADSYEINLKNLTTNTTIKNNASTNEATVLIDRGTPYEWFVVSKATGTTETATSERWKFYNEGPGITNFAPFPAEAIFPTRGANLTITNNLVTLEWLSTDIDNDISSYEVYIDNSTNPSTLVGTTETNALEVSVNTNAVYYWKIITKDNANNTSESEIFDFRVN